MMVKTSHETNKSHAGEILATIMGCLVVFGCDSRILGPEPEMVPMELAETPPVFQKPPVLSVNEVQKWKPTDLFTLPSHIAICESISKHDLVKLESLLQGNQELNETGLAGINLLYWAMIEEDMTAFEMLLNAGVNPDLALTDNIEMHPRYKRLEAEDNIMFSSLKLIKAHFCAAAVPYSNDPHRLDQRGDNLIVIFMNQNYGFGGREGLQPLIDAGIEINFQAKHDDTPCHIGISFCRYNRALQLLEQGADPALKNSNGRDIADSLEIAIWSMTERGIMETPKYNNGSDTLMDLVEWLDENYREIRWERPKSEPNPAR